MQLDLLGFQMLLAVLVVVVSGFLMFRIYMGGQEALPAKLQLGLTMDSLMQLMGGLFPKTIWIFSLIFSFSFCLQLCLSASLVFAFSTLSYFQFCPSLSSRTSTHIFPILQSIILSSCHEIADSQLLLIEAIAFLRMVSAVVCFQPIFIKRTEFFIQSGMENVFFDNNPLQKVKSMHTKKSSLADSTSKTLNKKATQESLKSLTSAKRMLVLHKSPVRPIPKLNLNKNFKLSKKESENIYEAFMRKVKEGKERDLPSAFKIIRIGGRMEENSKNSYESINFNILAEPNGSLIDISVQIISKFGLDSLCGTPTLSKLIKQLCLGYNTVSYHNFAHAFSLMHMFYQLTKLDRKFKALYTRQQLGFTLIAALAHDINHQGTNNAYENKLNTELSITANKESVLEKMHIRRLFQLMKMKNICLLERSKNPVKMKELMTRAILATDVSKHFCEIQKLISLRETQQFDYKNNEHRYFALEQAFHACDIGNPCLSFQEYMNWAALLTYEFNTQTLLEQEQGLEVTQMLRYKGLKSFYQGQQGFINALVLPLWKQLSCLWPGFQPYTKNVQANIEKLKQKASLEYTQ